MLIDGSSRSAETIVFDVGECMKAQIVRGLMALMLVGLPACVSQGTYDQTLNDLQSTKSHLDRLRVQNEALNKQVIGLKESNAKHKEELDKTNAQIASLKEEVSKERQAAGNLVKDLDRRSEEHTSELQSRLHLVCRLLLEKKKKTKRLTSCTTNIDA